MRRMLIGVLGAVTAVVALAAQANNPNPKPSCNMCPGTYIPLSELEAYRQKAVKENLCLLYTSPSPRDRQKSRMPSSA